MARTLVREVRTITVGTTAVQLVGPNPGRQFLVLSPPAPGNVVGLSPNVLLGANRDLATAASAFSTVIAAGTVARLISWSLFTTATGVAVDLKINHAGVNATVDRATGPKVSLLGVPLVGGDTINIFVTTPVAAAVGDTMLAIDTLLAAPRVTLGLGTLPVLDQGLTITAMTQPWTIPGDLVQGDVYGIADAAGRVVTVADVFLA
jgi:hypothetical protein